MTVKQDVSKFFGDKTTTTGKSVSKVSVIPLGIDVLDNHVIGCGGLPRGHGVELYGDYSSGKSTFAQWIVGIVQKQKGLVAWLDLEGTMDPAYAESSGVDLSKLIMPKDVGKGEDALHWIKVALASNIFDLIVLDSIPAMVSNKHIEDDFDDKKSMHTNLAEARMFGNFWKEVDGGYMIRNGKGNKIKSNKITGNFEKGVWKETQFKHTLKQKKTCLLLLNQKLDKVDAKPFGKKERTSGGKRKNFLFSLRLTIASTSKKSNKKLTHKEVTIVNSKNKLAVPLNWCQLKMTLDGQIVDLIEGKEKPEEGAPVEELAIGEHYEEHKYNKEKLK